MQRSPRALRPAGRHSTESPTINTLRESVLSGAARPGGLVVLTPYSGWHVAELDEADIRERYTLRGCLEGLAARLAAESRRQSNVNSGA